jgi:hypothetical protein
LVVGPFNYCLEYHPQTANRETFVINRKWHGSDKIPLVCFGKRIGTADLPKRTRREESK